MIFFKHHALLKQQREASKTEIIFFLVLNHTEIVENYAIFRLVYNMYIFLSNASESFI